MDDEPLIMSIVRLPQTAASNTDCNIFQSKMENKIFI